MTDKNQRLAQVTEALSDHFQGMLDASREMAALTAEMNLEFAAKENAEILTDLVLMSGTVRMLESDVVAYFSLRAGGR